MKKCPFCAEDIQDAAVRCRYCSADLVANTPGVNVQNVQQVQVVSDKPKPGVAAVLSLVIPGAGQMYSGKVGRGILWLVFTVIGYAMVIVPGLIIHLICIANAYSGATES